MKFDKFVKFILKRIYLDNLKTAYNHDLFLLRSNEKVVKYVDKPKDKSENETLLFLNKINQGVFDKKWFYWGIYHTTKNKLIGTICLWQFNEDRTEAEIGFELHPSFQRKGFMSEAIPPILNFAFNYLTLKKVIGYTHSENQKSIQLLKKYHFKLTNTDNENNIYTLTQSQFNTIP
jgi:ribosomal-protein-alanine N-acetyltransferase